MAADTLTLMAHPASPAAALRALAPVLTALADVLEAAPSVTASADEWIPLTQTGISPRTLRREIRAGRLPASRVGRHYRVRRGDLDAWLRSRRVPQDKVAVDSVAERAIARAVAEGRIRVRGTTP